MGKRHGGHYPYQNRHSPERKERMHEPARDRLQRRTYDLVAVQYHALKAGQTYGRYIQDAEQAGQQEIADFFRQIQQEDAARAERCHHLLGTLTRTPAGGPALS